MGADGAANSVEAAMWVLVLLIGTHLMRQPGHYDTLPACNGAALVAMLHGAVAAKCDLDTKEA